MLNRLFLLFFSVFFIAQTSTNAQTNFQIKQASAGKGLVYNTEKILLVQGQTNGISLGYQWGTLKNYYKTSFYSASIGYMKHAKETRNSITPGSIPTARSFVFGKQNLLLPVRIAYGNKRYFSEKDAVKGVSVGASYAVGPVFGLLKPYYIEYFPRTDKKGTTVEIRYSEETAKAFLDKDYILGAGAFSRGFREIKIQPGLHVNAGLHLDWGAFDEYVRALEIGIMADVFLKKVPILINNSQNRPFFVNLYANIQLGKRK